MGPAGRERSRPPSGGDESHLQGEAGQLLPSTVGVNVSGPQLIHWDACGSTMSGINGV